MAFIRRLATGTTLLFCLLFSVAICGESRSELIIGVVANQSDFNNGGCELVRSSGHSDAYRAEHYIFMSNFNGRAVMNINGHDIRLMLVRSTESRKEPKIGERTRVWYVSDPISVEVDYTVTGVCRPDDETCEVFYYSALIRVRSGSVAKSVPAQGLCGT